MSRDLVIITVAGGVFGMGHAIRCSVIANAFFKEGWKVRFFVGPEAEQITSFLSKGISLLSIPEETMSTLGTAELIQLIGHCDWLLLDSFIFDECFEKQLKPVCQHLAAIDGMLRKHDVDLLIDPIARPSSDRSDRHAPGVKILEGSDYLVINPRWRGLCKSRTFPVKDIGLSFGGGASFEDQLAILEALNDLAFDGRVHCFGFTELEHNFSFELFFHPFSSHSFEIFQKCDVAIGNCGMSAWERCSAGLPSLAFQTNNNQTYVAETLVSAKASFVVFEDLSCFNRIKLISLLKTFFSNKDQLDSFAEKGMLLCDGKGVTRILQVFSSFN